MTESEEWIDVGAADDFKATPLCEAKVGEPRVAISYKDGQFGVISNVCNHVGGPLGKGRLDGEYVVCPWHHYKFHRCTGHARGHSTQEGVGSSQKLRARGVRAQTPIRHRAAYR